MHIHVRNTPESKTMESSLNLIILVALSIVLFSALVQLVYADFTQLFKPNWAPEHIVTQGETIWLTLDNTTGIVNAANT